MVIINMAITIAFNRNIERTMMHSLIKHVVPKRYTLIEVASTLTVDIQYTVYVGFERIPGYVGLTRGHLLMLQKLSRLRIHRPQSAG